MRPDTQPDSLRVRPDYFGPARNYASSVDVGVFGMVAGEAREVIAGLAIALLDVTADAALSRSVPRVDGADWQPCALGLVGDLRLEIGKGPGVQVASLLPASPDPRADAFEVFDGDPAPGAFGRSDDLLGDNMVRVLGEAMLLHPALAKQTLRALGSLSLKPTSQIDRAAANAVDVRAGEMFPLARGGDIDDADVDAEPAESLLLFGVRHVDGHEEIELAGAEHEVGFSALVHEQRALMVAADERDPLSPLDVPDARSLAEPRQDASVVGDGPERAENAHLLSIELVRVGHLRDAPDQHLRGDVGEFCARRVVGESVDRELGERRGSPRTLRDPIASRVRAPKRRGQRRRLRAARLELHLHRQLHVQSIAHSTFETKTGAPPRPEGRGFRPGEK